MSLYIDEYYLKSISYHFESFIDKGNHVYNVRCPICGDSQKKKNKSRGYFYRSKKGNRLSYMCHNCGASMSLANFLKEYEQEVYQEYAMELFGKNKVAKRGSTISKEAFQSAVDKDKRFALPENTERIANLSAKHPAKSYLIQRKISQEHFSHIFYTDNFNVFMSQYKDMKEFSETPNFSDAPRIIFPFYDKEYNLLGFQGRALPYDINEVRYITIKLYEDAPKIYGLHKINKTMNTVYVMEGPIDSLFIPNSVAMMGSNIDHDELLKASGKRDAIYILDNEPRSKDTCNRLKKLIKQGRLVVIWPEYIQEKDINDLVLSGRTEKEIMDIIKNRTASGMTAELLYNEWRKV